MLKTRSIGYGFMLVVMTLLTLILIGEAGAGKSCPPYEYYTDCGDSCQTECATLNKPCLIRHFRCPDGCYCNKGYARDDRGTCIPIGMCT